MEFSAPVACSEDLPEQPPPLPPPSSSFAAVQAISSADVQPDAERVEQPKTAAERLGTPENPHRACPADPPPPAPDKIELKSKSGGRIEAENLGGVLEPGGFFRMGYDNVAHHVYHDHHTVRSNIPNKFPLTDSMAEPVIGHLDVISAGLAGDCHTLGTKLGLADATLKQIAVDYKAEGQHEVNYRVLALWKQRAAPAVVSLKTLARALADIGRGDLADELRKG